MSQNDLQASILLRKQWERKPKICECLDGVVTAKPPYRKKQPSIELTN